jgi:putative ABC transport system permease protein
MSFTAQELSAGGSSNWGYQMVGRLKSGISPAQAQSDANRVAREIMRNFPAEIANLHIDSVVRPLHEETVEQAPPLLRTLFLAVAVVLLIACVNLAGFMLVRAIRGQREIAVRLALGARAGALLRQTLVESFDVKCQWRRVGSGPRRVYATRGQEPVAGEFATHERHYAELASGWVRVAAGGDDRTALWACTCVCSAAHER